MDEEERELEEAERLLALNEKLICGLWAQCMQNELPNVFRMGGLRQHLKRLNEIRVNTIEPIILRSFAESHESPAQPGAEEEQDDRQEIIALAIAELPSCPDNSLGIAHRQRKPWSRQEQERFIAALGTHSTKEHRLIAQAVKTRTREQVKAHMQKYRLKIRRGVGGRATKPQSARVSL